MFNLIRNELEKKENISVTENGAIGYKTSNSALLDLNYLVSSLRQSDEKTIITLFDKAFKENRKYALKWLFYSRDIREGLGERRLFRICYRYLAIIDEKAFRANLFNIQEYGRWDDLVSLLGLSDELDYSILLLISTQLKIDLNNCDRGESISLLAKWLPSENASSKDTKLLAKKVRTGLGFTSKEYRQTLSKLRRYLNVVEVQMCNNEWNEIDYEKVPSLANLKYKNAFLRHDEPRRKEYLDSVEKGISKMHMKVATPVDIVSRYTRGWHSFKSYDETLELAWKNLKNIQVSDTMVVADGSGRLLLDAHSENPTSILIGQDLDPVACKMAVLNFYISGVRGSIIHMNTLTLEHYECWRVNNYIHCGLPIPHIELVSLTDAYQFIGVDNEFRAVDLQSEKRNNVYSFDKGSIQTRLV